MQSCALCGAWPLLARTCIHNQFGRPVFICRPCKRRVDRDSDNIWPITIRLLMVLLVILAVFAYALVYLSK